MQPRNGVGYQEYRQLFLSEGYSASEIGTEISERHIIYFGRAYMEDHETLNVSRGFLKIGKAKHISDLMRGRNQSGVDFRIYYEILFENGHATHACEQLVHRHLKHKNIVGLQGQRELYDIKDDELEQCVLDLCDIIRIEQPYPIVDVCSYQNNKRVSMTLRTVTSRATLTEFM